MIIRILNDNSCKFVSKIIICVTSVNNSNPEIRNPETGSSCMHYAVRDNNADMIRLLLKYGADINVKDYSNNTPLIISMKNKNIEISELLLANGADTILIEFP